MDVSYNKLFKLLIDKYLGKTEFDEKEVDRQLQKIKTKLMKEINSGKLIMIKLKKY